MYRGIKKKGKDTQIMTWGDNSDKNVSSGAIGEELYPSILL